MTALLIGVFAFFGAHTGLWLLRSGYLCACPGKPSWRMVDASFDLTL
jgi:hypothetical protein